MDRIENLWTFVAVAVRRLMHDDDEVLAEMRRAPQPIEGHIRIKLPTPMAGGLHGRCAGADFQEQFPLVSLDSL